MFRARKAHGSAIFAEHIALVARFWAIVIMAEDHRKQDTDGDKNRGMRAK
jgi:hypothetical protein